LFPGFYPRRTFRIFPAFYVYAGAIGLCAAGHWISLRPGDLLAALPYTTNYHYDRSWWLGHDWSLAVEEQFYLLFPLVFACFGRRAAAIASAAMIAISPIIYLWQRPFLTRFASHPWQRFPLNFVCLALAAWLSYRFVERPFLTLRRRIEQFRQSRRAIAPAASSGGMAP
jgi:peptidoglycan/LPS O-acetylase OafA/YrhL